MELESGGDTDCALVTVIKGLLKELGDIGNNRTSRDNLNYSLVEIGQNTESWRLE